VAPRAALGDDAVEGPAMTRFHEEIAALMGGTTYRVPVGGRATGGSYLPAAHKVAAALAFARRGDNDIGPDMALAIAFECDDKRAWIVRMVAEAMFADRDALVRRNRPNLNRMADAAYVRLVHGVLIPKPEGISERAWSVLVAVMCQVMSSEAEDAIARAARARRAA
jgi:hypothetical protein